MPPLTVKRVKSLSNDIDKLIHGVIGITEENDGVNFDICKKFIVSNFLYHRHLDVIAPDVWVKSENLHRKLVIQAQNRHANAFSSLVKKLRSLTPKDTASEDSLGCVLFLLMKLSRGTSSLCLIHHQSPQLDHQLNLAPLELSLVAERGAAPVAPVTLSTSNSFVFPPRPLPPPQVGSRVNVNVVQEVESSSEDDEVEALFDNNNAPPLLAHTPSTDSGFEQTPDVEVQPVPLVQFAPDDEPIPFLNYHFEASQWLHQHISNQKNELRISEETLMTEILWMLQGTTKLTYFQYGLNGFGLKDRISFTHLDHESLRVFLEPFCFHATCLVELENFVNSVVKSEFRLWDTRSKVYQGFACSLHHLLRKIKMPLNRIEKELNRPEKGWTLVKLSGELSAFFSHVRLLFDLYEEGVANLDLVQSSKRERVARLLSTLARKLDQAHILGLQHIQLNMLVTILLESCKPYLEFIEEVIGGNLRDIYSEFAIERKEGLHLGDEFFWENVLTLHDVSDEHFVFGPVLPQILSAAKSVQLLNKLGKKEDRHSTHVATGSSLYTDFVQNVFTKFGINSSSSSLMSNNKNWEDSTRNHFNSMMNKIPKSNKLLFLNFKQFLIPKETPQDFPKKSSGIDILESPFNCSKSLSAVLKDILVPLVELKCHGSNEKALNVLLQDHHLIEHLDFVRAFYLLEEGAPIFHFCSYLFEKILKSKNWRNVVSLNSYLEEIVERAGFSRFSANFKIAIEERTTSTSKCRFFKELEALKLVYVVPWPINIVLNEDSIKSYQSIFYFLLKIKCAKYSLDNLKFTENCDNPEMVHILRLLRSKFLCSVNNIHSFFMIGVLHSTRLELCREMALARNVKDLCDIHGAYLKKLLKSCFLTPHLSNIERAVHEILSLSTNFSRYWYLNIDQEKLSKLRQMEYRFDQTIHFFASMMKIARKQSGSSSNTVVLAHSLIPTNPKMMPIVPKKSN